jgi:hypothetical protein
MAMFVDTYFTKINPLMFKLVGADHGAPQEKIVDDILVLLKKEIEPLLADVDVKGKGPYFAGSERLTYVEVRAVSFLSFASTSLRTSTHSRQGHDDTLRPSTHRLQQRHYFPVPPCQSHARYQPIDIECTTLCQVGEIVHAAPQCHVYLGQRIYGSTSRGTLAGCEEEVCSDKGVSDIGGGLLVAYWEV